MLCFYQITWSTLYNCETVLYKRRRLSHRPLLLSVNPVTFCSMKAHPLRGVLSWQEISKYCPLCRILRVKVVINIEMLQICIFGKSLWAIFDIFVIPDKFFFCSFRQKSVKFLSAVRLWCVECQFLLSFLYLKLSYKLG